MKYFSEITNKVYDTPEELETAEKEVLEAEAQKKEKLAKRAERAKEVEEAFAEAAAAQKYANELLEAFLKDYGSFHTTIKEPQKRLSLFDDWFNTFFNV